MDLGRDRFSCEEVSTIMCFEVTYDDGSVEEIHADECRELGRNVTFVNYRVLFVNTVYTEVVRRLDRAAVVQVDEVPPVTNPHRRRFGPDRRAMISSTSRTSASLGMAASKVTRRTIVSTSTAVIDTSSTKKSTKNL
jgi:hypothetical protein